jgi:hypothetical protein
MNTEPSEVVIKEKFTTQQKLFVWLGGVFLLVFGGVFFYASSLMTKPTEEIPLPNSYGLLSDTPDETFVNGTLFYTANVATSAGAKTHLFAKNFDLDTMGAYFSHQTFSFAAGDSASDIAIVYTEDNDDPDGLRPAWYSQTSSLNALLPHAAGYNENNLVSSSDGTIYAYMYQTSNNPSSEITDWNIAIHDSVASTTKIINGASRPNFTGNGPTLVYLKADGVYEYNLMSETETQLNTAYGNLTTADDVAVSVNRTVLVLTLPAISTISVQTFDATYSREVGRIVTPDILYRTPVLSPDGNQYAVVAESDVETIEFRVVDQYVPFFTFSDFSSNEVNTVRLHGWISEASVDYDVNTN